MMMSAWRRRWPLLALALCLTGCATSTQDLNLSDPALQARVEERLAARKDLDLHLVDIDVVSQVVTLSGIVDSWQTKQEAGRIVSLTPGVKEVLNNLLIQE